MTRPDVAPEIVQLGQRPDLVPIVARWIFDEWFSKKPENRIENVVTLLQGHLSTDRIPLTLVALVDGEPAGTVSLVSKDHGVEKRPETPWLAAVYTRPRFRELGIAASLMEEAMATCRRIGLDALWVITEIPGFYEHHGWQEHERFFVDHPDDTILVMRIR